jgi:hypothetical protein
MSQIIVVALFAIILTVGYYMLCFVVGAVEVWREGGSSGPTSKNERR